MKEPSTLPDLIVKLFFMLTILYYLFGLVGYLAYGNGTVFETYFSFYGTDRPIFYSFSFIYLITGVFLIPYNCIVTSENFERINLGYFSMKDENGEFNRFNIFLSRMFIFLLSLVLVLVFSDLT